MNNFLQKSSIQLTQETKVIAVSVEGKNASAMNLLTMKSMGLEWKKNLYKETKLLIQHSIPEELRYTFGRYTPQNRLFCE